MSEPDSAAPLAHVCPHPARPDDHGCHLNDGTPVRGPHACWHCHDDPPVGHTCPCCGTRPQAETSEVRDDAQAKHNT